MAATDKEIVKALKTAAETVAKRANIKSEINSLIVQREDISNDLEKKKRNANNELTRHTEAVKIEINQMTAQHDSLKGELVRLPQQIKSKQNAIVALDGEIAEQKAEKAELEKSNRELKEINDGLRADIKKFTNKLAEV